MGLIKPLRIGPVELKNNLLLAPMAGVTDVVFRTLIREQGCALAFTEMVSAKAIFYGNRKTLGLMETGSDESPSAVQLFGSDPEIVADMAGYVTGREETAAWTETRCGGRVPFRTIDVDGASAGAGGGSVDHGRAGGGAKWDDGTRCGDSADSGTLDHGRTGGGTRLHGRAGAVRLQPPRFDLVDFNMGCPVPKIVSNGEGSALMKDPALAGRILGALVRGVAAHVAVTVKIRAGFDGDHRNAVEIAQIAESCGVAAITVHGRTREQFYSGRADYDIIRRVKAAVGIPVIGNGDLFTPEDVGRMYEETGCDGFMIARGALGNPWIFREILGKYGYGGDSAAGGGMCSAGPGGLADEKDAASPGGLADIKDADGPDDFAGGAQNLSAGKEEIKSMMLRHMEMQVALMGEKLGVLEMRKHASWYVSGLPYAAAFRRAVNEAATREEFSRLVEGL
ncbi:MAG: tRNA-dihydrouridine synthase [Lachnospiraceae bacterium]|jgi:tRNA-dihydrouridine synthase|nr:tRNA-dihydrouridine synthase [Lachnospiraceae bacterium]